MLIPSAAHLEICACGNHARIVVSNGNESDYFSSKTQLRRIVDLATELEIVTPEEAPNLLEQINVCSLPEQDEDDAPFMERIKADILEIVVKVLNEGEIDDGIDENRWNI